MIVPSAALSYASVGAIPCLRNSETLARYEVDPCLRCPISSPDTVKSPGLAFPVKPRIRPEFKRRRSGRIKFLFATL